MNPVRPCPVRNYTLTNKLFGVSNGAWYYVYVLISKQNGQFYTGVTFNLKNRLLEHNAGKVFSTKHKRPLELIYFEASLHKSDAFRRERYLKTGMGKRYIKNRLRGGLTG